jgi:plastocyanin
MTSRVRSVIGGTLAAVALAALPTAAQAATKTVDMGVPRASQKAFQSASSDVNDFFPHRVTIHVGDRVRFVPSGFHTVDLPGRRTSKLPIFTTLTGTVSGVADAGGAPFWFNGQKTVGFNPLLLPSNFGKRRSYTGAKAILSGLPLASKPKAMTVRFTRTGTFRYFCDVHLGMTGIVRVVGAGRSVPPAAADRATVRRQLATTLRTARALPKGPAPPSGTVDVGREGTGKVTLYAFVPSSLTVPTGTTVTFRMNARTEVHTATTGPGDPENQPASYLGQIEAGLQTPVVDPRAAYPSDPPGALAALTPTLHGNGFWNSGGLDEDTSTPLPPANRVTFAAPGTYQVFCLIHPFMHATVTVT